MEDEAQQQEFIGPLVSPASLLDLYAAAASPGFVPGIELLAKKYLLRRVRGGSLCPPLPDPS